MTSSSPAEGLNEAMENRLAGFPEPTGGAKGTLRFYLKERKKIIDSGRGEELDWSTAQGLWYLVEPYIPEKYKDIDRDTFVEYIRDICKEKDFHCRREDLKIIAGGRADLYFDGDWTGISWDKIEEMSETGTDGILIEKEGMARIFDGLVDRYGFAVINSRGFFTDYLDDVSVKSIEKRSNLVLLRDLDPSGIDIELGARQLGIICIGVNDEMLDYFGLTRDKVKDKHPPSDKNSHWKNVKKLAETTNPELRKEIPFLSKYRIELDKVHAKVGTRRLFEYVCRKLAEHHRDLNRVAYQEDYVQPSALGRLAYEIGRIGEPDGEQEATEIYFEQQDYEGLCDDISKRRSENAERVRSVIESNKHIKHISETFLIPATEYLEKVKTKTKKK